MHQYPGGTAWRGVQTGTWDTVCLGSQVPALHEGWLPHLPLHPSLKAPWTPLSFQPPLFPQRLASPPHGQVHRCVHSQRILGQTGGAHGTGVLQPCKWPLHAYPRSLRGQHVAGGRGSAPSIHIYAAEQG